MFFYLSKVFSFVANPFNLILLLLVSGWLFLFRRPKVGRVLIGCALISIFLFGSDFLPNFMIHVLENRISPSAIPAKIEGIIVLAGIIDIEASRPGLVELAGEDDRIIEGIILAQRHPNTKIIISGLHFPLNSGHTEELG